MAGSGFAPICASKLLQTGEGAAPTRDSGQRGLTSVRVLCHARTSPPAHCRCLTSANFSLIPPELLGKPGESNGHVLIAAFMRFISDIGGFPSFAWILGFVLVRASDVFSFGIEVIRLNICEGRCLRSFHATKDSGDDCQTLGYSRLQFNVFPCASATCGHFYHAKCVAQLLFPENDAKATEYTAKIANGAKFACPVHKCDVCKYGENKEVMDLQFAVCRRCPKSYHRRCLPRIYEFAQKVSADITIEDIQKRLVVPSTYTTFTQNTEKITLGMVERSAEAVKAALHMLENGASIEEAKTVCAPSDLFQLGKWKVVDFCCGSNDFSLLMKEKLEASGKNCFYKNFDLIQPKIMGLNPPFGFKSSLANQFINKALTFKPKLIILIVPKETERLDKKYPPYELIWEDSKQLSGKSFYLPGSFDADNKVMEQWNVSPPPLTLWSRSDWAKKHSEIAKSMKHLPSVNASYVEMQSEATGHLEMDETGDTAIPASLIDQLLADTFHDATNSPGDCWNDTNGRSRQPCNYETPGWSDPTQKHHSVTRAESDMSISFSDTADCQRQHQTWSISEHGGTDSQACDAAESAAAEKSNAAADCDEVSSACGPYHLPGDLPLPPPGRPPAGVQYWRLEDSPLVAEPAAGFLFRELRDAPPVGRFAVAVQYQQMRDTPPMPTPEDSWSGETEDSPPAAGHTGNLPRNSAFPGLPSRQGCFTSHQFLAQGMGHQAVLPGPSSSG
ncbi:hypothetical protein PR202_gb02757 [Eleusine coracana subsp. coracana]|uniref:Protein ENHANCED DOWNY MILDEW 2 n=1 Tax=Eleusine coracana subsp. coracana TaxID=191504 RepID=A0AAV5E075_ELECO|nr:hypothetical protein PR202_gb02757 [Eleusine coracana subsp. coracana]